MMSLSKQGTGKEEEYPLTIRDVKRRFSCFPTHYHDLWSLYNDRALGTIWTPGDVDLSLDKNDWDNKLTDNERHFLTHVLCFFASADAIVAENINLNFMTEVDVLEIKMFYSYQEGNEQIHSQVYSTLILTYLVDQKSQDEAFNAVEHIPGVQAKAIWALKFSDRTVASFAERLIAFICLEGIMFAGSFAAIFYFRSRNLLPGLSHANSYIMQDEMLHVDFAIAVYSYMKSHLRLSEEQVHDIFSEAVQIEIDFIQNAIPVGLIGLSADMMVEYIKFMTDSWLVALGYGRIYNITENPLDFMELANVKCKTNFFERRTIEYITGRGISTEEQDFSLEAEF